MYVPSCNSAGSTERCAHAQELAAKACLSARKGTLQGGARSGHAGGGRGVVGVDETLQVALGPGGISSVGGLTRRLWADLMQSVV